MADKNEKLLKPLRECLQKLATVKNPSNCAAEVNKFLAKGAFYEYHCMVELLDLLKKHFKSIPKQNKDEIVKLMIIAMYEGSNEKDAMIGRFHSFIRETVSSFSSC